MNPAAQFDQGYRNRIAAEIVVAILKASTDHVAGVAIVRSGEVIDALLTMWLPSPPHRRRPHRR